jgi:hypothetical protein
MAFDDYWAGNRHHTWRAKVQQATPSFPDCQKTCSRYRDFFSCFSFINKSQQEILPTVDFGMENYRWLLVKNMIDICRACERMGII